MLTKQMIKINLPNFQPTEIDLNYLAPCNTAKKLLAEMRDEITRNLLPHHQSKTAVSEYYIVN